MVLLQALHLDRPVLAYSATHSATQILEDHISNSTQIHKSHGGMHRWREFYQSTFVMQCHALQITGAFAI
jgi:hypothetical protein